MNKIGVLGNPKSHSLSPAMHTKAIQHLGLKLKFEKWELEEKDLHDFFTQLDKNQIIGGCITVPYKETVLSFISSRDESVEYIGAANWFKVVEGNIQGFNTDHLGFINSLPSELRNNINDIRVVVIGAGGSSKAVIHGLVSNGCSNITIINRTLQNAKKISKKYKNISIKSIILTDQLKIRYIEEADLIVNTTTLGMSTGPDPDNAIIQNIPVKNTVTGIDLVYAPVQTPFLKYVKGLGGTTINGIPVLINQGIAGLNWITGLSCPYKIMKDAISS